ncbi:hypothetical protein [Salinispora oceanensis]|uniref:hypothetical protein n=1 Tax=Salinispora oceanensis TaxID=1050199 RepID=UPI001CC82792|nr:hypothetical protein [Salinispora oceanensis]
MVLLVAVLGAILVPVLFVPARLVGEVATKHGRLLLKSLTTFAGAVALATSYAPSWRARCSRPGHAVSARQARAGQDT